MTYNPKGKLRHLARLTLRSEALGGGAIPEDEMLCDFVISNDAEDSYGSIMSERTLRNYAEDGASGRIPFMLDHAEGTRNQLGNVIAASYDEAEKCVKATMRVLRDTDTTPEQMRNDEFIRRMERGFYTQCSVGFRDATEICNIPGCGKEIFDFYLDDPCPHIPKRSYDGVKCTYTVENARLREVSLVASGSNPNAKLLDARAWGVEHQGKKELGAGEAGGTAGGKQSLLERDGQKYRESLIDAAIVEGVRAEDNFDEDLWRSRFKTLEADIIVAQTATWKTLANLRWGEGGRQTNEGPPGAMGTVTDTIILPNHLFEI